MNNFFIILAALIIILFFLFFMSGSNVESISAEQLRIKLNSNKKIGIIDVRTNNEYYGKIGHIEGSILVPSSSLKNSIDVIKSKGYEEIYTICLSGARSAKAVNELKKYDIEATNVRGGMLAWNLLK